MKLYFREQELSRLREITGKVKHGSQIVVIGGRRKVGKTTVIKQFLRENGGIYITITPKSSSLQLHDLTLYLRGAKGFNRAVPDFESWYSFFAYLLTLANDAPYNVVIDEFHNLDLIDHTVTAELLKAWTENASASRLNLLIVSNHFDFLHTSFYAKNAVLKNLPQTTVEIKPFSLTELIAVFRHNHSPLSNFQICTIYIIFGGLPKYYYLFDRMHLWDKSLHVILKELLLSDYAPLGFELKDLVVNEFTRGNKIYLSILQAIAAGNEQMSAIAKIADIPVTNLTKYLFELEKKKRLITRRLPIGTDDAERSKFGRYYISNPFENFWFRFIHPDNILYEMQQYDELLDSIVAEIPSHIESKLPKLVLEIISEYKEHPVIRFFFPYPISEIGSLWNRKGYLDVVLKSEEGNAVLYAMFFGKRQPVDLEDVKISHETFKQFEGFQPEPIKQFAVFHNNGYSLEAEIYCRERNIQLFDFNLLFDILTQSKVPYNELMREVIV